MPLNQAPVMLSGKLLNADGQPLAGAWLTVEAQPSTVVANRTTEGVGIRALRLGRITTDQFGAFQLRVPTPANWTGYVNRDGSMLVTLMSSGPAHSYFYGINVTPPTKVDPEWHWDVVDEALTGASVKSEVVAARTEPEGGLTGLVLKADSTPKDARAAATAPDDPCGYRVGWWEISPNADNKILRYARLQRVRTLGKVSVKYNWSTTRETVTDAAGSWKGGDLFRAGYRKVQRQTSGVNFKVVRNRYKDLSAQFAYRPWNYWCNNPDEGKYFSGLYEWRPRKFTGGNRNRKPSSGVWNCNGYVVSIANTLWVARDSSTTFSAGVGFPGVSLRAQQTNSDHHKLYFVPHLRGSRICGRGTWPTAARMVREKY